MSKKLIYSIFFSPQTTEAATLADELTEIDVFENCRITIFDNYENVYPNNLDFFIRLLDENYKNGLIFEKEFEPNFSIN